ncbi:MAG TPA: TlpA disulfide reductase family protein [Solirubrobacterales bacterium]|nr:TlpA disulfide reductase family protein [Solirubrobacterales bacterium]
MSGKTFAAVIAVLAVIALLGFGVISKGEKTLKLGEAVPAVELELLAPEGSSEAGETASIGDFSGQWVLLNIWASWCGPCKDESPDLVDFQDEHGGRDFTVLGIQTQDGTEDGLEFVDEFGLNYTSLRDGSGDYADELGAAGVPETILVDPEGNVAYYRPGPVDAEILEAEILPLIQDDTAA